MSKIKIFSFFAFLLLFASSCKTEFEKVRTSGDPELMKATADKYYEDEQYVQAQTLFETIIPFYRGKEEAAEIFYHYAYTHYYLKEYILASHYFKNYADTYFNNDNRENALFMAAYSNYEMSPNPRLDQSYSELAIAGFQLFINTFPNSSRVQEANDLIDEMRKKEEEKAYMEGQLYFDLKQFQSAVVSFGNMLTDYPETKRAEEIRYKIVLSTYKLAENSIYSKKEERFKEALERIEKFLKKYPKSKYKKELRKLEENSNNQLNQL